MAISPSSPLTGAAQADLTSPTYTLTADTAVPSNRKQWAVTALGGTQTGVTVHSVSSPFTLSIERPVNFRQIGSVNPVTGVVTQVPNNVYVIRARKGVTPLAGQSVRVAMAELRLVVPAGSDTADAVNLEAMLSAMFGFCSNISSSVGDTVQDGVL